MLLSKLSITMGSFSIKCTTEYRSKAELMTAQIYKQCLHRRAMFDLTVFGVYFFINLSLPPLISTHPFSLQVPLLPFLPIISLFINVYLMMQLDRGTWMRFAIWMALGTLEFWQPMLYFSLFSARIFKYLMSYLTMF